MILPFFEKSCPLPRWQCPVGCQLLNSMGMCWHLDGGVGAILPLQGASNTMVTVKKVFLRLALRILGTFWWQQRKRSTEVPLITMSLGHIFDISLIETEFLQQNTSVKTTEWHPLQPTFLSPKFSNLSHFRKTWKSCRDLWKHLPCGFKTCSWPALRSTWFNLRAAQKHEQRDVFNAVGWKILP